MKRIEIDEFAFSKLMNGVKRSVSTGGYKESLEYIQLKVSADKVVAFSTDGYRAARVEIKHTYPVDEEFVCYIKPMRLDQYYAQTDCKMPGRMADVSYKYKGMQYTGMYCVIIAKSKTDLEIEGKVLQHCVGRMNYDVRMAEEKSLIFFVRNAEEPNMPYVTLEYSLLQKRVVQCYGAHDSRPSQVVLDFVYNKWQPYATEQLEHVA